MTEKRLPSFNDFSPGIIGKDLRPCLQAIVDGKGDDAVVIGIWVDKYFNGVLNKRASTNIPATLRSTGMIESGKPFTLSTVGQDVLSADSAEQALERFCTYLLRYRNGDALLLALKSLGDRGVAPTKRILQEELTRAGISGLSTGTTDHTTMKNWFMEARFLDSKQYPNDVLVKSVLGMSTAEADEFFALTIGQQVLLKMVRRLHLTDEGPFHASPIFKECLANHPDLFDPSHFAKKIRNPLVERGWLEVSGLPGGAQGGKSGFIKASKKLLEIPIERIVPDFEAVVPNELREKLQTPASQIYADLYGEDKYKGGLALELLALRMTIDLGLDPRHFRLRSERSAFAEVDLIAEAAHLMFSRWTIQCKRNARETKVPLSDVAKEVGLAIFTKAHVVMVVTTSDFSSAARDYAREMTLSQHLQFLLIPGHIVGEYLKHGRDKLIDFVRSNARSVMALKRGQPLPTAE